MEIRLLYRRKTLTLCFMISLVAYLWIIRFETDNNDTLSMDIQLENSVNEQHMLDNISSQSSKINPQPCYITAKQKGRLGNQIFQYAALYYVTRSYRECIPFLGPDFKNLTSTFNISIPTMNIEYENEKRIWEVETDVEQTLQKLDVENIPLHKNITIKGFYLSFKYIHEDFRKEITFNDEIRQSTISFLEANIPSGWKGKDFVRVGIHIRRTDRDTAFMTKIGYIRPPLKYYQHAMSYFMSRYDNIQFIVASDDISWCQMNLNAPNIIFSQSTFAVDLTILSSCDHMITSVGTFSWWAGWLCKGTTIYYAKFPPANTKASRIHKPHNWYPPDDPYNHWIAMI